ncbi:MAG TPA: thiamine pyrophosphate-dependent enzyme [Nitrososphaerales archaeon]|nr:thiamine pyrophosphate-dependent enzyme [Nitrososphaerales archaeon]
MYQQVKGLKELPLQEPLSPGHRLCPGCGASIVVREVLLAAPSDTVVVNATGCLEVSTALYGYSAWNRPWIHSAFENAAAVASGIDAGFKALARRGEGEEHPIVVFGGDGGTYDIGIQALSGAMERGHRFLYVCYDNEAYMNTGIQRSGGTPRGAWTTTTQAGSARAGKTEAKKDLMAIVVAHHVPYAATASISHWRDLMNKVRKALSMDGPTFLHVMAPCMRGWRFDGAKTVRMSRLAVETRTFPLYEVEGGVYRITVPVPSPKPAEEFLKAQGRYSHLFLPQNAAELETVKREIEGNYIRLEKMSQLTGQIFGSAASQQP